MCYVPGIVPGTRIQEEAKQSCSPRGVYIVEGQINNTTAKSG